MLLSEIISLLWNNQFEYRFWILDNLINPKTPFLFHYIQLLDIHPCNLDEASSGEECHQFVDGCFRSLYFHLDISVIEVLYPAGKPELVCFVLRIIPEADTLHASVKYDMFSDDICHVVLHLYVFFLLAFLLKNQ